MQPFCAEHTSLVQSSWSSQLPLSGVLTQPMPSVHESFVQSTLSLQSICEPPQTPFVQMSLSVQSEPSSQGPPLLPGWVQLPPAQTSSVHTSLSDAQGSVLLLCTQLPLPLHSSSVQTLLSVVHEVPAGSAQLSVFSLQRSLHSPLPLQGLPEWPQVPAEQV